MSWGQVINNISFGTIYNESWTGEYPFVTIVGDANDLYKRTTDDTATMEAHSCLVTTFNNSVQ